MTKRICLSVLCGLAMLAGLSAAPGVQAEQFLSGKIEDRFVDRALEAAKDLLPQGRMRDGSSPHPVTPHERKDGVIPREDASRIVSLAADTALTQHCELDWQNLSFRPLMRCERDRGIWSDRQLAYIGILHGYAQGAYRELLKSHQRCSANHKQAIVQFFARKGW